MEGASITETASAGPPARKLSDVVNAYALPLLLVLPLAAQVAYSPHDTLDDVKTGLSNGTIWALIALGYTLVYGIVELINFAHGEVFMIGSFVSVSLWATFGVDEGTAMPLMILSIIVVLILAMFASGTLNVLIERVAYRPLRNAPKLAPLITAIGMSFILQNVGLLWLGGNQQGVPDLVNAQHDLFSVFGVTIENADVLSIGVTIPLLLVMTTF